MFPSHPTPTSLGHVSLPASQQFSYLLCASSLALDRQTASGFYDLDSKLVKIINVYSQDNVLFLIIGGDHSALDRVLGRSQSFLCGS